MRQYLQRNIKAHLFVVLNEQTHLPNNRNKFLAVGYGRLTKVDIAFTSLP